MKCPHCKEDLPRNDYNICPFCAKTIDRQAEKTTTAPIAKKEVRNKKHPTSSKSTGTCPYCKEELPQDDYKICPFCAEPLESEAPPPIPKKVTEKRKPPVAEEPKPPTRAPRTTSEPPLVEVVVKVQDERKKQRLNPLWVLILLLLLIVCCCGLMLTEQVEVPEVIAPQVNPILDNMRKSLPAGIGFPETDGREGGDGGAMDGGGNGKQPEDEDANCEDLIDQMMEHAVYFTECNFHGECFINVGKGEREDEGWWDDFGLWYSVDGSEPKLADECEDAGPRIVQCTIPDLALHPVRLDYWLKLGECEGNFGYVIDLEEKSKAAAEETPECCEIIDVTNVQYTGTPGVTRFLEFFIDFGDCPPTPDPYDCIDGSAYVGADPQEIFWDDVECCGVGPAIKACKSVHSVDQKESTVRVELEYDSCEWEVFFHTPPYFKGVTGDEEGGGGCPSGQSMCGGSCCAGDCEYGECDP